MSDLRFALRTFRKNPVFTIVAVLTLGLGIGANTAMFSVVSGVLLDPLPYAQPDRLVRLWTRYLPQSGLDIERFPLSVPELVDYREQSQTMQSVVPYATTSRTIAADGHEPARVRAAFLGAGMFDLLGVEPLVGRVFAPEEELPDAALTAVLSHGLWRRRYGADRSVIGRTIEINGLPVQVIGVMPPEFVFPSAPVEMWLPLGLDEAATTNRFNHFVVAIGRLAPGITLPQAEAELEAITAAWNLDHEHHAMGHFVFLTDLQTDIVGDSRRVLWLLMAAVALVLLIACVNVANLLLARTEKRHAEVAVRTALGADRGRLIRQFLIESLVLAGAGAAIGFALAAWATPAIIAINPEAIPRTENVVVDLPVLAFTILAAAGTALLFGIVPALHAGARGVASGSISEIRVTGLRGRARFRRFLVGAEVALSVVVVLAAGLVTRSLIALAQVDPGVDVERVLTFDLALPASDYGDAATVPGVYEQILERIRALPGVTAAGSATAIPIADDPPRIDFTIEGAPAAPAGVPSASADAIIVQQGYFDALGIPLLRGRLPEPSDGPDAPMVAVINQTTVERYWPGEDPIGRRFRYASAPPLPWITVAGIVADTKVGGLTEEPRAQIYLPHRQVRVAQGSPGRTMTVVVRTALPPTRLVGSVRGVIREIDPILPLANVRTMEDVLRAAAARPRLTANLLGVFALIALALATVGIYGVVSFATARRTREIGVRMALGARHTDVLRQIVAEGMRPVVVGVVLGAVVALAGARVLSDVLFGVSPRDPVTFVVVPLVLAAVAGLASYLPARRAARVAPMESLRYE